jgi:hypothetical protein
MNDDIETKKLKTDSSISSTNQESVPSFINENTSNKKICEYGEACYRQKNPVHTAQYDHPCKSFSALKNKDEIIF